MRRLIIALIGCLFLTVFTAQAAHTEVKLLLADTTAKPGDTIWAGVELKMDPGWHTYWKNPGEAGIATAIKWELPPGVTAGEIQWPLPEIIPPAEVTTYGYEHEVMLLVPLALATNLPPGPLVLKADVSWLECQEQCVPGRTSVETTLNIGGEIKPSDNATAIESWKGNIPKPANNLSAFARWATIAHGDTRNFAIEFSAPPETTNADFFPNAYDNFEVEAKTWVVSNEGGRLVLIKPIKIFSGDWPKEIFGVLVLKTGSSREGFEIKLPIADQVSADKTVTSTEISLSALPPQSLLKMLVYAFIGGLILNLMPCVLPVIALKILGFVQQSESSPGRVRAMGLVYAAGVLISFLVLAAIVIGVKAAGHQAGWGMQFGSPIFLVCLTVLVTLVALNLFGVFEVTLGGSALDKAGKLASKHGAAGAFFNGVLATVLATPCTAPFLSIALGFAFAQSAMFVVLIFLAVGIGLATPYVVLSWNPAWLKFLPKPGAWMEKFKIAMGFPMLATMVWLLNIAASSYGKNILWLDVFLVLLALAAWIFGEFFQRGRKRRGAALIIALALLAGGYAYALEDQLHWREAVTVSQTGSLKESADGIDWQRWNPEAVAKARDEGHAVLVDFTADWCLTCQVNKKTSLEISSVRAKLKELKVVAFVGDYTHTPDDITKELQRYGRAGVPLVLVYPKDASAPAIVLPEVLTPGIVLDALERAAR